MINKVTLIGRLGRDAEIIQARGQEAGFSFTMATSRSWKDKTSGEWMEKTQWHRIKCFNVHKIDFARNKLIKGATVYIEGELDYREFDGTDGSKKSITEILINPFGGEIKVLSERERESSPQPQSPVVYSSASDELNDEIPF